MFSHRGKKICTIKCKIILGRYIFCVNYLDNIFKYLQYFFCVDRDSQQLSEDFFLYNGIQVMVFFPLRVIYINPREKVIMGKEKARNNL